MPRIRSVHPNICVSETMATLTAEAERTFVRLWTHCDDAGRAVDNPRLIKAAIYPLHDDVDADRVDRELADLETAGLIHRYESEGKRYLVVVSWHEFQRPQRPKPSVLPEPEALYMSRTCITNPVHAESSPPGALYTSAHLQDTSAHLQDTSAQRIPYPFYAEQSPQSVLDTSAQPLTVARTGEGVGEGDIRAIAEAMPALTEIYVDRFKKRWQRNPPGQWAKAHAQQVKRLTDDGETRDALLQATFALVNDRANPANLPHVLLDLACGETA